MLTEEKKKDALSQMLLQGGEKAYKKIQLQDKDNKMVGSAAEGNIQLMDKLPVVSF